MNRYQRQTILPEVGAHGQKCLSEARVLIVGAGGLAAPVLQLLAGAGLGHLTIVDGDVVALSNLHRQTLFSETDCGRPKAQVAAERCRAINSEITTNVLEQALTPYIAPELVADSDVVLDCADSYAASYTLSDVCFTLKKPLISASALGLSGYVGGFCGGSPSLRALFPDAPDTLASCATVGVLGPVVSMIGAMQAQMALNKLLSFDPSPLGQLVQFDARTGRSTVFRFDDAPEPERYFSFVSANQMSERDQIIELRDTLEAPVPIHPSAARISVGELQKLAPKQGQRLVLCCATGLRAWRAAESVQSIWSAEIVLAAASAL
ncbi:HesA/MoeB/ThiF family protein [Ruegeria arenilitoris]|uniref:HesA/MoeB/ThiF family protein n=1 Tax=Ruegeria arenilitoris TaxID=1173585 RepID=UPI0014812B8D